MHAWLCSLVQDLDSRQSLTVRGVREHCTAHIYMYVCVCVISPPFVPCTVVEIDGWTYIAGPCDDITVHLLKHGLGQDTVRFVIIHSKYCIGLIFFQNEMIRESSLSFVFLSVFVGKKSESKLYLLPSCSLLENEFNQSIELSIVQHSTWEIIGP